MDKLFEAIVRVLLTETDDTIIGKSRDEYESAMQQSLARQKAEQDAIAAFMQKQAGGKPRSATGGSAQVFSKRQPTAGGTPEQKAIRSKAWAIQNRLGIEVGRATGPAFDSAINDYCRFTANGSPRVDRDTGEFKPLDPYAAAAAYKQFFRKVPHDSKWAGKV